MRQFVSSSRSTTGDWSQQNCEEKEEEEEEQADQHLLHAGGSRIYTDKETQRHTKAQRITTATTIISVVVLLAYAFD